jgi:two-component system NtrC family response regulator
VRELENVIKRAVIMADGAKIGAGDVGLAVKEVDADVLNLRQVRDEAERARGRARPGPRQRQLEQGRGDAGVSRPTLYDLMDRFGLR